MSDKIEWPENLPLPRLEAFGSPGHRTLTSRAGQFGAVHFHNVSPREGGTLDVAWRFTVAQMDEFSSFFLDDLGNGTACFVLDLLLPSTTTLKRWVVRFSGSYVVEQEGDLSLVRASLLLVEPELEEESVPAERTGWEAFLVLEELGSGSGPSISSSSGVGSGIFILFGTDGQLMVKD